ncbi:MAG: hypothetical protein IJX65_01970 [Alistipes sp.]|nr:hypothetical protein [Alistipes sp.]
MKRFFIVAAALLLSCGVASAQKKGDMFFGGTTGITIQATSANNGEVAAGFAIQPEFGVFVANNCKLGVSVGYALSGGIHSLTACPNFAYYLRLCDGLYYTPGIEAGFVMAAASGNYAAGVGIGLQLFTLEFRPTKHFGLSAGLASLNFVAMNTAAFNFNLGVNPTVGVKYYF